MTLEEALVSYLMADSNVTGLIGTDLFPDDAPPGQAAPYVIYERTGTEREQNLQYDTRAPIADIKLTVYGTSKANAEAIKKALRTSQGGGSGPVQLMEFTGTMGSGPGVVVQATRIEGSGETGGAVKTQDESGQPAWMAGIALRIAYLEQ